MKKSFLAFVILFVTTLCFAQNTKAPAFPLITHDPYFSIWSTTDLLTASTTKHWTGANHSLIGMLKVDGLVYSFLGKAEPMYKTVVPASDEMDYQAAYTESNPGDGWMNPSFDDSNWKNGMAPFGNDKVVSKTKWLTKDIWVRRKITINQLDLNNLFLKLQHDDDVEVFLNGEILYSAKGSTRKFIFIPIKDEVKNKIKKSENIIAVHVTNKKGGSWLDVGIVAEKMENSQQTILTAIQKEVTVNATQTAYQFTCGKVDLSLTFTSPLILTDLDLLSRPVSYINTKVISNDGAAHDVELYVGASSDVAVNTPIQPIKASRYITKGLAILKAGSVDQPILQKKGDDLRIDWGYM